ncbi:zinc finger protein 865-like [Nomascus leucogenys]|uniref:zinc finger protein 865-like n=1 Tax=Nomascus leucogenys TaxID=61853 RepID=UPI00122D9613|nr:zinc finger protein 865-like [Nomascus leucogenys]
MEGFNKSNDEEIQSLIQHELSTSHGFSGHLDSWGSFQIQAEDSFSPRWIIGYRSKAPPLGAAPPHPSGCSLRYCFLPEEALRGGAPQFPQLREDPGGGGLAPSPPASSSSSSSSSSSTSSSSRSEGGGLRLKTLGLRVFSAAAAAAAATSLSSRPGTQRSGRRMPVDAHLFSEFLLPGPAKAAGENVRGRGDTQGLRVSEARWPPPLLLAQETPTGAPAAGTPSAPRSPGSTSSEAWSPCSGASESSFVDPRNP